MNEQLAELVRRAQRRDAAAFAGLIRHCERAALSIAYAHLRDAGRAGDAVQEAFLKAWQKLGELEDPSRFAPWLCGIVRNLAIDQRRRMRPTADPQAAWRIPDERPASDPVAELEGRERCRQIDDALGALDEVSRSAVVLRYYEGLSSREIGDLLGLSPAAIDMRLSRAREELRHRLVELTPDDGPVKCHRMR